MSNIRRNQFPSGWPAGRTPPVVRGLGQFTQAPAGVADKQLEELHVASTWEAEEG